MNYKDENDGDIVDRLRFGCPFKEGSIAEYDVPYAERIMERAAREIEELRRQIHEPLEVSNPWRTEGTPIDLQNIEFMLRDTQIRRGVYHWQPLGGSWYSSDHGQDFAPEDVVCWRPVK